MTGIHSGFPQMFCSLFQEQQRKYRWPLRSKLQGRPGNSTAVAQSVNEKKEEDISDDSKTF